MGIDVLYLRFMASWLDLSSSFEAALVTLGEVDLVSMD